MTATEELRRMLDERGVEYRTHGTTDRTWFEVGNISWFVIERENGNLTADAVFLTPEQAIAVTLGRGNAGRYVGLRQGKYWERTENSDYYCGGCGWKVTDHDSFCPECGGALHKTTLGSCNCTNDCTNGERTGTCKLNNFADVPFSVDYEIEGYDMDSSRDYATLAECSSCGAYVIVPPSYHHVLTCDGDEVYQPYLFCPHCGRRIEVDE